MPNTVPESIPQLTYVATRPMLFPGQPEREFLVQAKRFHQIWGLKPKNVDSLEDIVADLAKRRGKKKCIRIVTHANSQEFLLPLFKNSPIGGITAGVLDAFAQSYVTGLSHLLGDWVDLTVSTPDGRTILQVILDLLRKDHVDVLQPFELAAGTPTGALLELFQRSTEKLSIRQAQLPANVRSVLDRTYDIILNGTRKPDGLRGRVKRENNAAGNSASDDDIRDLDRTITNLPLPAFFEAAIIFDPQMINSLSAAVEAITRKPEKDRFQDNLGQARRRCDANTTIDIRGCQAGVNPGYLRAVSNFFGAPGARPHVTAPDRFQQCGIPETEALDNGDFSAAALEVEVPPEVEHWSNVTEANNVANFASFTNERKLINYLDQFVLPVARVSEITGLDEDRTTIFVIAPLNSGSSSSHAVQRWHSSQWANPNKAMEAKITSLANKWINNKQAAPYIAVAKNLLPATSDQETFYSPDPRYANHIKSI